MSYIEWGEKALKEYQLSVTMVTTNVKKGGGPEIKRVFVKALSEDTRRKVAITWRGYNGRMLSGQCSDRTDESSMQRKYQGIRTAEREWPQFTDELGRFTNARGSHAWWTVTRAWKEYIADNIHARDSVYIVHSVRCIVLRNQLFLKTWETRVSTTINMTSSVHNVSLPSITMECLSGLVESPLLNIQQVRPMLWLWFSRVENRVRPMQMLLQWNALSHIRLSSPHCSRPRSCVHDVTVESVPGKGEGIPCWVHGMATSSLNHSPLPQQGIPAFTSRIHIVTCSTLSHP